MAFLTTLVILLQMCCIQLITCGSHGTNGQSHFPTQSHLTAPKSIEEISIIVEDYFKMAVKQGKKLVLPQVLDIVYEVRLSSHCMGSLLKLVSDLSNAKLWAIKMLDAMSKLPPGILDATMADFGDFDECLGISVPLRNGSEAFRGRFCAIEARLRVPPPPKGTSVAQLSIGDSMETLGSRMRNLGPMFPFFLVTAGVCLPSTCLIEDVRAISAKVAEMLPFDIEVKIPKCYEKESFKLRTVHYVVIATLATLLLLAAIGTALDLFLADKKGTEKSYIENILLSFSVATNVSNLFAASAGNRDMKSLHGLKVLSMAYVILGHTYAYADFKTAKHSAVAADWYRSYMFSIVENGYLSVDTFFFLSGFLVCYVGLQVMEKTKGKINVPFFIIRRYIRLTPALLLSTGLLYFLPLISSGPFWHTLYYAEVERCNSYWWTNLLYIGNWMGLEKLCIVSSWYMAADFQLHVLSILFLILYYRSPTMGHFTVCGAVLLSAVYTGVITYIYDIPPYIQSSVVIDEKINEIADKVYVQTFTHLGSHSIGVGVGYFVFKHQTEKFTRSVVLCGWCLSAVLCLSSLFGVRAWTLGPGHGPLVTALFAGVSRPVYVLGIAWVAFACITGHAGPVNKFLSSPVFVPLSRLVYNVYLLNLLVLWTRTYSRRERMPMTSYNMIYEYFGHLCVCLLVTLPFYLLLQAPLGNLEKIIFSRMRPPQSEEKAAENNQKANGLKTIAIAFTLK